MASHRNSNLFALDQNELAFLQKLSRSEYQFITAEEQTARQRLRVKLNEVVLNPKLDQVAVNLKSHELLFLAQIVRESASLLTAKEKDARSGLQGRLEAAATGAAS